jgi:hypothetical protein
LPSHAPVALARLQRVTGLTRAAPKSARSEPRPNVHWVRATVDPASREVFSFHSMIVKGN